MRTTAENTIQELSHAGVDDLVIDDRPVIVPAPDRRPGGTDDPVRSIRAVIRRWRLLAFFVLVGAGLGWLSATMATEADTAPIEVDHYQAAHVLVLDSNVPETQTTLSVRNLNMLAKRITIGEVPRSVAARLDLAAAQAEMQVRVIIRPESDSIDILAIGETPARAERLADAYADELVAYLEAEATDYADEAVASAQARLDEADANLAQVRADLSTARLASDDRTVALLEQDERQFLNARTAANATLLDVRADGIPVVPLETLEAASGSATVITSGRFGELVDRASSGRNIEVLYGDDAESDSSGGALSAVSSRLPAGEIPRVGGGAALGLLLGLMVIGTLNRLDGRVRSKRQVEEVLDLPVVAEIPSMDRRARRKRQILARVRPRTRFAEQFRGLASTVSYARRTRPSRPTQVVLVTSPGPAEGKTTTVANLGAMLAEAGDRVLLVNCDFRRPKLHLLLGADDRPRDILETSVPGIDLVADVVAESDIAPTEVVTEQRRMIERARELYDVIVIDTAPLLATNDAVDLLDLVDDVVLVLRAGKTSLQAADRAVEILERRRSHVLGIALSDIDAKSSDDYRYYYGGYDYGDAKPALRRARKERPEPDGGDPTERPRSRRFLRRRSRRSDAPADAPEPTLDLAEPSIDLVEPAESDDPLTESLLRLPTHTSTAELEAMRFELKVERLRAQREQLLELELRALERRQAEFAHQTELIRLENERRTAARARQSSSGRRSPS